MKWLLAGGESGKLQFPIFLGVGTCDLAIDGEGGAGVCEKILGSCPWQRRPCPQHSHAQTVPWSSPPFAVCPPFQQPGDVVGQPVVHNVQPLQFQGPRLVDLLGL